jgi:BirA family biotin operon repressor/biotin-[acetyl-CoA-carboxylase] ligase
VDLGDLSPEAVAEALPGRPLRAYPALLSTGAEALAWARAGPPAGAVVLADYQASPRGRGGLEWRVEPGVTLGFSLILRPALAREREGWLYTVAASGLADALGVGSTIHWPDEVRDPSGRAGAVGVHVELLSQAAEWAVVNVIVDPSPRPRALALARAVEAIERRLEASAEEVLADYVPRLQTIGRRVRARLVPMGPSGVEVIGTATHALADGALVIQTSDGVRVAVRPQHLGLLEPLDQPSADTSSG